MKNVEKNISLTYKGLLGSPCKPRSSLSTVYIFLPLILVLSACSTHQFTANNKLYQSLEVTSSPSTALIYLDGQFKGLSPIQLDIERLSQQKHTLTALPYYAHQFRQDIKLESGELPNQLIVNMDIPNKRSILALDNTKVKTACKVLDQTFPSIYFKTNLFSLEAQQLSQLEELACQLLTSPIVHINIFGYADYRGDIEANKSLSLQRALSVKQALVDSHYPESHLHAFAQGETIIFNDKHQPLTLKHNRKVMFEVQLQEDVGTLSSKR